MVDNVELAISCPKCSHDNKTTIHKLKALGGLACAKCDEMLDIDIAELEAAVEKTVHETRKRHELKKADRCRLGKN